MASVAAGPRRPRRQVARPHQVVLEREVDDAVGRLGGRPQPVEIVQVAAPDLGASRGEPPAEASERASPTT